MIICGGQKIPAELITEEIWEKRFEQIKNYENYLYENGTCIIKLFLHVSKEEQAKRFLERIDDPAKNWKFSVGDLEERKYWDDYMKCYEEAIAATSTKLAPWHIIPADKKWFARLATSEIIINTMKKLDLRYPELSEEQKSELEKCKLQLLSE